MKSLLFCCLFGTFLATGMGIECEICSNVGQECSGYSQTCDEKEDTCVVYHAELKIEPVSVTFITKACGTSDTCHLDYLESTLYRKVSLRSKRACCIGEECKTLPTPVLQSEVIRPNGLQCPGCLGLTSAECNEHLVSCRGTETQCLTLVGKNDDQFIKELSLKACASESLCTLLEKKIWTDVPEADIEVKCTPALPLTSQ
ncbi:phospholipase A2 inhibitor gamma subunit B-like [Erythrolamprus reginae]|uniref:phospholipase A2 inhibitor gamma subunit B-like n=1 Tax=Erythrolamprus reginae TaxID=121349 RepID=UPI00396C4693